MLPNNYFTYYPKKTVKQGYNKKANISYKQYVYQNRMGVWIHARNHLKRNNWKGEDINCIYGP